MWINPTDRATISDEDEDVWLTIQEKNQFALQQYQPHLDKDKIYKPQFPFRILFRTNVDLIVALDNDFRSICEHWKWVEDNLIPKLSQLEDLPEQELYQFAILKLSSLSKFPEREKLINDYSPANLYKQFYPDYILVQSFECCYWDKILIKGIIYFSDKNSFFYSALENYSIVIPYEEITLVKKDMSYMISNSVNIFTVDENQYLFSNFENVEETYDIILGLWDYAFSRIVKLLESEMHILNTEFDDDDEDDNYVPPPRLTTPSASSSFKRKFTFELTCENLINFAKLHQFISFFGLPMSETLISSDDCILEGWGGPYLKDVHGILYLSTNFITFHSIDLSISVIIPSFSIANIEFRISDKIIISSSKSHLYKFHVICNKNVDKKEEPAIIKGITKAWEKWKKQVFEISFKRDNRSQIAKITKEKQLFFDEFISKIEDKKLDEWNDYSKLCGLDTNYMRSPQLLNLVRSGLPNRVRGVLWQIFSGSRYRVLLNPLEYRSIQKESFGIRSLATEEIERDLNRTFPEHPFYQKPCGIDALRRVLVTYSFRNPSIGYCQSMHRQNIVAAFSLLFMSEEDSYWMLSTMCEEILPDYYAPSMIGSTTDQLVFEYLFDNHLPHLSEHFKKINMPLALVTIPWFLCIFIGFLSWESTLRVLDCFFYDGRTILFQVGLAILKLNAARILQLEEPHEITEILKNTPIPSSTLLQTACIEFKFVNFTMVDLLHKKFRASVLKDLQWKLEKRKQTTTIQLSMRPRVRRMSSVDFPSLHTSIPSPLPSPTIPRIRHFSNSAITNVTASIPQKIKAAKMSVAKKYRDSAEIFSYRSSRHMPITVAPVFSDSINEEHTKES